MRVNVWRFGAALALGAAIRPVATSAPTTAAVESEVFAFLMRVHPFEIGLVADGRRTTYVGHSPKWKSHQRLGFT